MASNRHLGRIIALQALFELDFRRSCGDEPNLEELIERNLNQYKKQIGDRKFVSKLIDDVQWEHKQIDEFLAPLAPDWPIDQIARIDRIILEMAVYELQNNPDTPRKVVINEAVELAKEFGSDNSSKFVNGVLGSVYKKLEAGEHSEKPKPRRPKKGSSK